MEVLRWYLCPLVAHADGVRRVPPAYLAGMYGATYMVRLNNDWALLRVRTTLADGLTPDGRAYIGHNTLASAASPLKAFPRFNTTWADAPNAFKTFLAANFPAFAATLTNSDTIDTVISKGLSSVQPGLTVDALPRLQVIQDGITKNESAMVEE